jgi:hypothetical protein
MKGKLKKTETGWSVIICDDPHCWTSRWQMPSEERKLPVYIKELSVDDKEILEEGKIVYFEKVIKVNEETKLREFYAKLNIPPFVSDDFTIGPEGAFEMTDDILEELKSKNNEE